VASISRVVAIGASNLTRGFRTVVATARTIWGPDVHVVAALGHGRSYGADSSFLFRRLPGILQSGIWQQLESTPAVPTKALVTDVGNDIVYGFPPEQVLAWVDEALTRLTRVSDDVVLTDLPMDGIRRLSPAKFHLVRSVFFPSCRLSFEALVATAEQVNVGLAELAGAHRARFLRLEPSWYGFDPIHIRPSLWPAAWQEILGVSCQIRRSRTEALRLYALRPEQQWLFGVQQRTTQAGAQLRRGGRVWLY
jgi:hypothetical protein